MADPTTQPRHPQDTVGYVLRKFPVLSETFILNEILALEARGIPVHIFSLERPNDPRFHDKLEDKIDSQAMTANVLVPIGAAIAASSAILLYFSYAGGEDEEAPKEGDRSAARLRLHGGPTADGGVVVGAGWDF